jgi:hypothetical protein
MKKLFGLILILATMGVSGQTLVTGKWAYNQLWINNTLAIPDDTLSSAVCGRSIAIKNNVLYFRNSTCVWQQITGGGGGVTGSNGIRTNGSVLELGDIAGQNTAPLTVDRYIRGGNKSIFLMGNKTNEGVANLIFKDTLISTPGNPKGKFWIEFPSLDGVAAPFYMGTASVDDGAGFNNHVMNWGFNLSPLGTRVNSNYGAIGISCEGAFQQLQEFHLFWIPKDNIQRRLISFTADTALKTVDQFSQASSWSLKNVNGTPHVWVQYTGGNGGTGTSQYLYAGTSNQYRLQTGFGVSGGNTSASISTDGPGQKEFHLDESVGDWDAVFLPSFFSNTTYNQFTTQVLPAVDGTLRLGSVTEKWLTMNSWYTRAATGMRIGDFSSDQLPSANLEIYGPGSGSLGNIYIQNTTTAIGGIVVESPNGGHSFLLLKAQTNSGVLPQIGLVDQDDANFACGIALERGTSPILATSARNDMLITNAGIGKDILFATNAGAGRIERGRFTSAGNLVVGAANNITGTATNNNAAAGNIGEYVASNIVIGIAVSLTTATPANVTSISLTAGDWDVEGIVNYSMTGATATRFQSGSHSTSATFGADNTHASIPLTTTTLTDVLGQNIPVQRFSLSGTTTVYLVAQSTFSVGTVAAYGLIRARRVR